MSDRRRDTYLPHLGRPGTDELISEENDLDHKSKHLVGNIDDGWIRLGQRIEE
jgi:hypothetical protein